MPHAEVRRGAWRVMTAILAIVIAFAAGCYKAGSEDRRVAPFEAAQGGIDQAVADLQAAGAPVAIVPDDAAAADALPIEPVRAQRGVRLTVECEHGPQTAHLFRFADEASRQETLNRIGEVEEKHRQTHPDFRFAFLANRDLLLIYDEVLPACRGTLTSAFLAL